MENTKQLTLSQQREQVSTKLQNYELALQKIANDADLKSYDSVKEAITRYSKGLKVMGADRLEFTNNVKDLLITPAMQYEKRAAEYEGYKKLIDAELGHRQENDRKKAEQTDIQTEIANFKNYCISERIRIETEYVTRLGDMFNSWFNEHVSAKTPEPKLSDLYAQMDTITPEKANKFQTTMLTKEQMMEVYNDNGKIDLSARLLESKQNAKSNFDRLYADALKNTAAVKAQMDKEKAESEAKMKAENEAEKAMAVVINKAEISVETGPGVKRQLQVEIHSTEEWAVSIMVHYINNPAIRAHIRVTNLENLSLKQIAAAIGKHATETGETFKGLNLKEIEK